MRPLQHDGEKAMMKLSDDLRRLVACYRGLAERSAHPRLREGFANLAARYDAIAARREAFELDPKAEGLQ
jgi:hypothetical protein